MHCPRALTALVSATALLLTACGTSDGELNATGGASLSAVCEEGGVATVGITYGTAEPEVLLVGNDAGVEVMGGVSELDRSYGLGDNDTSATLTVEVLPTEGACRVAIADKGSDAVLERESGRGDFTMTARISR